MVVDIVGKWFSVRNGRPQCRHTIRKKRRDSSSDDDTPDGGDDGDGPSGDRTSQSDGLGPTARNRKQFRIKPRSLSLTERDPGSPYGHIFRTVPLIIAGPTVTNWLFLRVP